MCLPQALSFGEKNTPGFLNLYIVDFVDRYVVSLCTQICVRKVWTKLNPGLEWVCFVAHQKSMKEDVLCRPICVSKFSPIGPAYMLILYFRCLEVYVGCLDLYLCVWTCIWTSGLTPLDAIA